MHRTQLCIVTSTTRWSYPALVVAWILAMGASSRAQGPAVSEDWRSSDWALQFQLNPNFDLSGYGAGIAFKNHFGEHAAVRFGFDFRYATNDLVSETQTLLPQDLRSTESDSDIQRYRIYVQALRAAASSSRSGLYWGGGVFQSYQRDHVEATLRQSGSVSAEERTSETWSAGLQALLGVEWFVARDLALDAEFGLSASYAWGDQESSLLANDVLQGTSTGEYDSWSVGAADATLGVTFYF